MNIDNKNYREEFKCIKTDKMYFHLSPTSSPLKDGDTVYPNVPNSCMIGEDEETKRFCVGSTIGDCICAINKDLRMCYNIFVILGDKIIHEPNRFEVPDVNLTNEVWIMSPCKIKRIGSIFINESFDVAILNDICATCNPYFTYLNKFNINNLTDYGKLLKEEHPDLFEHDMDKYKHLDNKRILNKYQVDDIKVFYDMCRLLYRDNRDIFRHGKITDSSDDMKNKIIDKLKTITFKCTEECTRIVNNGYMVNEMISSVDDMQQELNS